MTARDELNLAVAREVMHITKWQQHGSNLAALYDRAREEAVGVPQATEAPGAPDKFDEKAVKLAGRLFGNTVDIQCKMIASALRLVAEQRTRECAVFVKERRKSWSGPYASDAILRHFGLEPK